MGDRISLLRVDEAREEEGVPDEEDWGVVAHHVPVALLRVELDGEAPEKRKKHIRPVILNLKETHGHLEILEVGIYFVKGFKHSLKLSKIPTKSF